MNNNTTLNIVILAAGRGTRMCSTYPKLLHLLGGKPILQHVIDLALSLNPKNITIMYSNLCKNFKNINKHTLITWIKQKEILGTGYAINQIINNYHNYEDILILYGDVPLISKNSIQKMLLKNKNSDITLLTAKINSPEGYGRIIRKNKKIVKIIEHKDATQKQLQIKEINSGIFIVSIKNLKKWIYKIKAHNHQNEYYITDIILFASQDNYNINSISPINSNEILGINNLLQLSYVEKIYQKQQVERLVLSGITIYNSSNFSLRGTLKHGKDIKIDNGVILEGIVKIGNSVIIGPNCIIKNSTIDDFCIIKSHTIIDSTIISKHCVIGPFAHVQHGTILKNNTHIGNFVEIKNTILGNNSKAKHLTYLGNSIIGNKVNIGAGTITCNYDGKKKSNTIIGDNVFIGSNTQLIAPINIKSGTIIAAGTTVMKSIKKPCLVYNKKQQIHKNFQTRKTNK